ncbi:lasso peptide biosynthesis B2 protein [Kutzneria albida]|uniref:Microcin J25-processing protein McjB C-terminal domain-containing protein n=1 Tax=Kutzneria albida DSM 43870 TaxID=1449976 RepID=W5W8T9_9PSEU|nr:lasso peptide biosynthesis B2 protein [Kutzneria albida]AHH96971.1 hypothetical protein KALB_3607 [Kutzneria albida DSM 43870]
MTTPMELSPPPAQQPIALRVQALLAVALARTLARRSPARIRAVLDKTSLGARPATHAEALRAFNAVMAVSRRCRGPRGCLPRSIATALLCRAWGCWPVWIVGIRRIGPFAGHAWIEAQGELVGEMHPDGYFLPMVQVGPKSAERGNGVGRPVEHTRRS